MKTYSEIDELKERISSLEKVVLTLVSIEKISRKDLTKSQKDLLKKTLDDIKHKRHGKFMSLDQLKRKLRK